MKKKYLGLKVWVRVIAVTFVLSVVATSGSVVVLANELILDETQNSESYFNDEDLAIYYSKEEKNSELALEKIKEEYGDVPPKFNEEGEILLTPEDELRMEQAISQYLAMTGFNPRMRVVGKNWWNSTGFVAGVIDVGLIAIGLWTAASNFGAVRTLLRNNRKNITRMVEKQILSKVGIGVGGFLNSMIDIALVISGASVGGF